MALPGTGTSVAIMAAPAWAVSAGTAASAATEEPLSTLPIEPGNGAAGSIGAGAGFNSWLSPSRWACVTGLAAAAGAELSAGLPGESFSAPLAKFSPAMPARSAAALFKSASVAGAAPAAKLSPAPLVVAGVGFV